MAAPAVRGDLVVPDEAFCGAGAVSVSAVTEESHIRAVEDANTVCPAALTARSVPVSVSLSRR